MPWAEGIESSLDDAQALAALLDEIRSFPPLALRDAVQIVGEHMADWRWKELIRTLKDADQLQSTRGQHRISLAQLHAWMETEVFGRPARQVLIGPFASRSREFQGWCRQV